MGDEGVPARRCFLGLVLPDTPRAVLEAVLGRLAPVEAPVRWVKPANLHVTLKFLGSLGPEPLAELQRRLAKIEARELQLALHGLGSFPPRGTPRVVWAGIDDVDGGLRRLAAEVERAAVRVGVPREGRPYHPHVTLGRLKGSTGRDALRGALQRRSAEVGGEPFTVARFTLFESTLTPDGAVFRRIAEF